MEKLTNRVKELAACLGATAVGIATTETLAGGPPSTDLTYVLPGAKSSVSFLLPLNQDHIEPYLSKKDRRSHETDNVRTNTMATGISFEIANYLTQKGHPSVGQTANLAYRTDTPGGALDEKPPISHRYLAVRSGIGHFGWSGNVITKGNGAALVLGSLITTAELVPTDPLPPEENYCDECRLCYSDATLQELLEVLKRPKFQNLLKANRVETTLEFLHSFGTRYTPKPCYLKLPDPDDIIYLDLALATKAKYIITGNKKHFPEKTCADIKVLSPGEFLKINL